MFRILFVAPSFIIAKRWFQDTADLMHRGYNRGPSALTIDVLDMVIADGAKGVSLQFVVVKSKEDVLRLQGYRVQCIVEHDHLERTYHDELFYAEWRVIKPHMVRP